MHVGPESLTTRAERVPCAGTPANTPHVDLHRSHFSLFCEDRNDTRQRTLSAHLAAMFSSDGISHMGIGYGTAANAESASAAQGGARVDEERNSPEVMSGDLSMGPAPDATVATPSAAETAPAEETTPFGAYPLSAELAQVLEEGLTPEDANQDRAQRGDASRTPPRRGRGRPKVHSAPAASRSARSARGRPRREDEDVQLRQQQRRREESASSQRSGPVSRDEGELLVRQLRRRRSMRGEAQEPWRPPRDEEELLLRQLRRRRSMRGEAQEPWRPARDEEDILLRQLQRRQSMRGEAQERGPVPRDEEEDLEERQQRRRRAERGEAREPQRPPREAQELMDRQLRRRLSPDFADARPKGRPHGDERGSLSPAELRRRAVDAGAEARSRTPRRHGRRWGGDRLRRPHARERPVLPDENWAARTLWDVENDDENDRTYLFDTGPMDYQCGYCQAFYWHGEKTSKGKFNLCCGGRTPAPPAHGQPPAARLPQAGGAGAKRPLQEARAHAQHGLRLRAHEHSRWARTHTGPGAHASSWRRATSTTPRIGPRNRPPPRSWDRPSSWRTARPREFAVASC